MERISYLPQTSQRLPIEIVPPELEEDLDALEEERQYRKFLEKMICWLGVCWAITTGALIVIAQIMVV